MRRTLVIGFTLIELIIVIAVLGIISVTAVPKFFNIGADAREAKIRAIEASLHGAIDLFRTKTKMAGIDNGQIVIDGVTYRVINGYPATQRNFDGQNISGLMEVDDTIYQGTYENNTKYIFWDPKGIKDPAHNTTLCAVYYSQSQAMGEKPVIEFHAGGIKC